MSHLRLLLPALLAAACARAPSHTGPAHEATSARAAAAHPIDLLRPEPALDVRGLGTYRRKIATSSPAAQRAFDDGLNLLYSLDPDRAARAFRTAARHDPKCAACFAGLSLALAEAGAAERSADRIAEAQAAAEAAARVAKDATGAARALVDALTVRYRESGGEQAFVAALASAAARFPTDLDVKTLYARAAMAEAKGALWPASGEPPKSTLAIVSALEDVLARSPRHPGANVTYALAIAGSPHPQRALAAADRLAQLEPGSAAFAHAAARVYYRVGRYVDAASADERALALDPREGRRAAVPPEAAQRARHEALLVASATAMGSASRALDAARRLAKETSHGAPSSAAAAPALVLARFGRFQDVLHEPLPPAGAPVAAALGHFARGIALASLGRPDDASGELAALAAAARDVDGASRDRAFVDLAATMLEARIAESRGDATTARRLLEDAAAREDALPRSAALPWLLPARDSLGVLLLDGGHATDAEAVYRAELDRAPESVWPLLGLAESLRAEGRAVEATIAENQFRRDYAGDAAIRRSRF